MLEHLKELAAVIVIFGLIAWAARYVSKMD